MKQLFLVLLCFLVAAVAEAKVADVAAFKLKNGLEVVVIENHKAPVVLQMLYYKTGSVNDPKGKGGIAHLLEHLMFRGTSQVPDKEFNRLTDVYGAQNNAYTTYNETGYYEFSDISKLELMMALEADRMQNLSINEEAFAAERDIVLQERMQRFESNPVPLFYETVLKILWQDSPLANPVSGSPAEIKALTAGDAQAFYERWYRPDNALLVLAGDITKKEAEVLVKKYYGGLKAERESQQAVVVSAGRAVETELVMKLKGVTQPRFMSAIRLEAGMLSKKDVLALTLFAEYLAGDDTAYLYDKLVYEDKGLLSVDMDVSYEEKLGGMVSFYATPADETQTLKDIAMRLRLQTAEGLRVLDAAKLEKIKNQVLSAAVYLQENPESAARFAGGLLLLGYTPDEVENYDLLVREITPEDVAAAWHKVLGAEGRIDAYLEGE
ncbi:MAG: insulinase family protein [Acetobacter sp.]|nr:insulinase family protein [Acetobacter sp.]